MESYKLQKSRVAAGATFLDDNGPAKWYEKIDTDKLDIQSSRNCILGQLYGEFFDGRNDLGLNDDDTGNMAFRFDGERGPARTAVNDAWREEIVKRREAAAQAAAYDDIMQEEAKKPRKVKLSADDSALLSVLVMQQIDAVKAEEVRHPLLQRAQNDTVLELEALYAKLSV